jgi:glycosyltransferase involved in cell wall biosynthesis
VRIVFSLLDAGIGGGQRVALAVAQALAVRGHGLGVIAPGPGPALDRFIHAGAEIHLVDLGSLRRPSAAADAAKVLRGYELLYSHTSVPGEILGGLAALRAGRPHLVHQHVPPHFSPIPALRTAQTVLYRLVARRAHFVAVAEHVGEALVRAGAPRYRVAVIPNGIAIPEASDTEPGDCVRVGMLGRLDVQKGVDTFVEAARLAHLGSRASFVVGAAPGPSADYEERLRTAAAVAGVEVVDPNDGGPAFLAELDVVVMPSRSAEGHPLVLLEAMAIGRPVVATVVPGIVEVIESEETGLLVAPDDPQALAGAIRRLGDDAQLRTRLGRRGRAVVEERYTLEQMLDRTVALIEGLAR